MTPIVTPEQPVELLAREREHRTVQTHRPLEAVLLQALVPQAEAVAL